MCTFLYLSQPKKKKKLLKLYNIQKLKTKTPYLIDSILGFVYLHSDTKF